jgi:ubiquinone/menaquinone biosynthesis C-methylase UbiE
MDHRQLADQYTEFEDDYWWFVGRRKIIMTLLEKYLAYPDKTSLKILDLGCGTGANSKSLSEFGEVCASDYSLTALNHVRERGIDKLINCSASNLPFRPGTFDIIAFLDVLTYFKDDVQVLKELRSCLKKEGTIFISVPAFQFLWSNHDVAVRHLRRYNSSSLIKAIKKSGLQDLRISYFISFVFPFIAIYRIITRWLKLNKKNAQTDLIRMPMFIDKTLRQTLFLESKIIRQRNLPFGLSLFCIAKNGPTATAAHMLAK